MEKKVYTITVYTENRVGLLNRISGIFLRRHINIESINVSKSEIDDVSRMIIVTETTEKWVENIVKQIERQVEVIKAYYHTDKEIIYLETSLFKMPTESLFDEHSEVQKIINKNNVNIVMVFKDFYVISKSGTRKSIDALYKALKPYGIMQFAGSARISVSKKEMNVSSILKAFKQE